MSSFSIAGRIRSFGHAFRGAVALVSTQQNARIHAVATVAVCVAGGIFKVSAFEWGLLVIAIGQVWAAEALNTALEFLADEVSEEKRSRIGKAKDVAAFGVLVAAISSFIIGVIVFLPHIWGS